MYSKKTNRAPAGWYFFISLPRDHVRPFTSTGPDAKQKQADLGKTPKESTPSSYDQIAPALLGKESFHAVMARDKADKESVMARQKKLLEERYDLTPRPDGKVTMSRGKPIPVGPTAKLPDGMTWEQLAAMSSDEIREKGLFPKGFLPLPHPKHEVGGMVFPQMEIKQFARLATLRRRFRLARALPAGVSAGHFPDHRDPTWATCRRARS